MDTVIVVSSKVREDKYPHLSWKAQKEDNYILF
jgi:hypothetical protein